MSFNVLDRTADTNDGTDTTATGGVERIHADHISIKRLGHWTDADRFEVRARGGSVVLDLRSPRLPAEVEVQLRLERAMVKLLLPDDAVLEYWDLDWTGRGKVKDAKQAKTSETQHDGSTGGTGGTDGAEPAEGVRRVRLVGSANGSEVRVNRGGVAMLAAMCTREYLSDLRQAHKAGAYPTIDDPTRAPKEMEAA